MTDKAIDVLKTKLDADNFARLERLGNDRLNSFILDSIELCGPADVMILDDSPEHLQLTRDKALETGEEIALTTEGHTVHWDGPSDQGRDRERTKYLVPEGETLSKALNQTERQAGLDEVRGLMKDSMVGRTMVVRFLTLGPNDSIFSVPCVECTDSWYVSHSLDLLYRGGYEQFARMGGEGDFFAIMHASGKLDDRMVSVETDKRRIYIDYTADTVYTTNTQYAGNTVGLKKLALRLSIRKADREGWLAEHMFLMGVSGPGGRKTYMAGAFPSACGKTSTAMLPGEKIVGDDIAYFREIDGKCMAVNAESGIFGIIQSVNAKDDPSIWDVLDNPGEVIFSNVLVNDRKPYWLGMDQDIPAEGENFTGQWHKGKTDAKGAEVPPAHKNARYAVTLKALANCDSELDNPTGVPLDVIVYGGRDANGYVPVQQSFDWDHGVVAYGASLETETTFAVIGQEGRFEINLMSIQDFVAVPLGKYVQNNLDFGKKLTKRPLVFGVNYFLRDEQGAFVNGVRDKHVWIKWMELRVHGEADAIETPTGMIPLYDDLKRLFKQTLDKDYSHEDYISQFSIRAAESLAKIQRVTEFHRAQADTPEVVFEVLAKQKARLEEAQAKFGDRILPECFSQ